MKNRLTKALTQYIASDDDLRPAMQGIACHENHMIATDGHNLTYVEVPEDDQHFADSAIYRIDSSQAMNGEFVAQAHSFVNERYPNVPAIIPEEDIHHEVNLTVEVMYRLFKFLKTINAENVVFKFSHVHNRPIMWEVRDGTEFNGGLVNKCAGLTMPRMMPKPENYKRKRNHLAPMKPLFKEIVEAVNSFEPAQLQEA